MTNRLDLLLAHRRGIRSTDIRREALALVSEDREEKRKRATEHAERMGLFRNSYFTRKLFSLLGWGAPLKEEEFSHPYTWVDGIFFWLEDGSDSTEHRWVVPSPHSDHGENRLLGSVALQSGGDGQLRYQLRATVPCPSEDADTHGGHDIVLPRFQTLLELGYAISTLYCPTCAATEIAHE